MAAAKKTARGRKQDGARVAGGQKYEVSYEAKTQKDRPRGAGSEEGGQEGRKFSQARREAPGALTVGKFARAVRLRPTQPLWLFIQRSGRASTLVGQSASWVRQMLDQLGRAG
jgi:hypothetical protein